MTTAAIRDTIALAKLHEQQYGHLVSFFERQLLNKMHITIQLPEQNPIASLVEFVIAYIEHVPNFIDAARAITQQAKLQAYAEPFLCLAQDYFLKPPEVINGHVGLDELMDEAYLAHRLIEEINDQHRIHTSIPLVPLDMTMSNLIIHSLIGEPFANQLDAAVNSAVHRNTINLRVYKSAAFTAYIHRHKNNSWEEEEEHWPCLTDKLSINLQFAGL